MKTLMLLASLALIGCSDATHDKLGNIKPGVLPLKTFRLPSGNLIQCRQYNCFHGNLRIWDCPDGRKYNVAAGVEVYE